MTVFGLLDDVIDELVKEGYGTLGTTLFKYGYKAGVKDQIAVKLIPGQGPIIASGGSSTARPKLQIYVLNQTRSVAASKADAIRDHFVNSTELVGQGIWADQDCPIDLGLDDKINSYMFIIEFQIFA